MTKPVTIDELRTLLAVSPGQSVGDDCILDFYAWQDAELSADAFLDDNCEGLAEMLVDFMRGRIKPVDLEEVTEWLKNYQDPDAIGQTREDLLALIEEFHKEA